MGITGSNGGHVMALTSNGKVYSWGNNRHGNTDGNSDIIFTPRLLVTEHSVIKLAIGKHHTIFLTRDGEVKNH